MGTRFIQWHDSKAMQEATRRMLRPWGRFPLPWIRVVRASHFLNKTRGTELRPRRRPKPRPLGPRRIYDYYIGEGTTIERAEEFHRGSL